MGRIILWKIKAMFQTTKQIGVPRDFRPPAAMAAMWNAGRPGSASREALIV